MKKIFSSDKLLESQRGVALISVLILLSLMSAMAVALVYKVNHEQRLQAADSGNTVAYYGAEAGMEKMIADLSLLYTQEASPTNCDIAKLQQSVADGMFRSVVCS